MLKIKHFYSFTSDTIDCAQSSLVSSQIQLGQKNLTFLYSILADKDLLILNEADLFCAGCESLKVSGEST